MEIDTVTQARASFGQREGSEPRGTANAPRVSSSSTTAASNRVLEFSSSRVLSYDELFAKRCCFLFFKMEDGRLQSDQRAQAGRALAAAPDRRASAQEQRNVDDALGYR